MRVIFCGSGSFATPTLRAIHRAGHQIARVVTPPPRPAGRGGRLTRCDVDVLAEQLELPTLQTANINDDTVVEELRELRADLIVVAEFGQFLRGPVRQVAEHEAINLHGSVLPALRGAAPVNWAIITGQSRTGVSTFRLVDAMDAGPVYHTHEVDIEPAERAGELKARLANIGSELVLQTLDAIALGQPAPVPQDDSAATVAPRLIKSHGHLDFSQPAESLVNRIRGCWPWPGGRAVYHPEGGKTIAVTIEQAFAETASADDLPGTVLDDRTIATGSGRLRIDQLKPAGKRSMSWADFCNGYRVQPAERFTSPSETA